MSGFLPRFIELVLAPAERNGSDSVEVQREALEGLRNLRPGILIDHIEEPPGGNAAPPRSRPVVQRLRSHCEARTFDELRVFEIGRLSRPDDPGWHETIVQYTFDARAILVDSTGLVADPAEGCANPGPRRAATSAPAGPRPASRAAPDSAPPSAGGAAAPAWPSSIPDPLPPPAGQPALAPPPMPSAHPTRPAAGSAGPRRTQVEGFLALCEGRTFCEICGQRLIVQSLGHERRRLYTCSATHLHPATPSQPLVYFPVETLDKAVWEALAARLAHTEVALDVLRQALVKGDASEQGRKEQLTARLERLERDEIEVLGLRAEDRISEGAARHRLSEIAKSRRGVQEALSTDGSAGHPLRQLVAAIEELDATGKRTGRTPLDADAALRQRLIAAACPTTAEYGVYPLAAGGLEVHSLLHEHDLQPGLRHRAQALGAVVGGLGDRVTAAQAAVRLSLVQRLNPARLLATLRTPPDRVPGPPSSRRETTESRSGTLGAALTVPRGRLLGWSVAVAIAVVCAVVFQPEVPEAPALENLAVTVGHSQELAELYRVPGGWMGLASPDWAGASDKATAQSTCAAIAASLNPGPTETVTLLKPGGIPIAECGPPVD